MSELVATEEIRQSVIQQLEFARRYTLELIESVPGELWLSIPPGGHTHMTWQVGHLAVAEYGLLLFRLRGRGENDKELVPSVFRKQYSRGSQPSLDTNQMGRDAMLERFAKIHAEGLSELRSVPLAKLNEPCEMPYAGPATILGSVMFAPMHEMIHAGQIGMLRRSLGLQPVR